MLNGYSLKFKDQKLENKYESYQLQEKQKPLLLCLISVFFIYVTARVTYDIIMKDYKDLYIPLAFFLCNILLIAIIKYRPSLSRQTLVFVNHFLILTYFASDNSQGPYYHKLSGAVLAGFQMIIICSGEFMEALQSIITIFTVYFTSLLYFESHIPYQLIASTIMMIFLLIITSYKNCIASRSQFRLSLRDNQWDQILMELISEPCIIFFFEVDKCKFTLKKTFKFPYPLNSSRELLAFLRSVKVVENHKSDLEATLYKEIQKHKITASQFTNKQPLQITINNGQPQQITYQIFYGENPLIVIQLTQSPVEKIIKEYSHQRLENQYQFKYQQIIKIVIHFIKMMQPLRYQIQIQQLYRNMVYQILMERIQTQQPEKFYLRRAVITIKKLYREKSIILSNISNISVIGHKAALQIILIHSIACNLAHRIILLQTKSEQHNLTIKVKGYFNNKSLQSLQKRFSLCNHNYFQIKSSETGNQIIKISCDY